MKLRALTPLAGGRIDEIRSLQVENEERLLRTSVAGESIVEEAALPVLSISVNRGVNFVH